MSRGRVAAWLVAALSVSCAPAGRSEATAPSRAASTTPPASPSVSATAVPAPSPVPALSGKEQALQRRLSAALRYVSEIRQLPAVSEVKGRLIARDEIERFLSSQLDEQTPPDVLQATQAVLYGLGTVEAGFDYRQSILKLMTSELLGFYDPKQKTFFVEGNLSGDEAEVTLFHELVHALQDQHYDLSHLSDFEPDSGDRQSAVHALAEGDATSAMLDALMKPRGSTALDVPDSLFQAQTLLGSAVTSAPPVLVRSLLAPYVDGLAFTNELRRQGGWAAVDAAWRAPPESTEQLLHLEKFRTRESPQPVPLPPAPPQAPELVERFHDVMGEQTLRIFFEEWLPARTAATAAADWGGDRLSAFADERRERWAVAWHLRFDTPAAAERAFVALARAAPLTELGAGRGALETTDTVKRYHGRVCRSRHTQGAMAIVRSGSQVAVAIGPFALKDNAVAAGSHRDTVSAGAVTAAGPAAQAGSAPVSADPGCQAALAWALKFVND